MMMASKNQLGKYFLGVLFFIFKFFIFSKEKDSFVLSALLLKFFVCLYCTP